MVSRYPCRYAHWADGIEIDLEEIGPANRHGPLDSSRKGVHGSHPFSSDPEGRGERAEIGAADIDAEARLGTVLLLLDVADDPVGAVYENEDQD